MKVDLTEGRVKKFKSTFKKGEEVTLEIDKSKRPSYEIKLTDAQLRQINKGKRITLNKKTSTGYFYSLGVVISLRVVIAKALGLGAISGLEAWGKRRPWFKKGLRHLFEK